MCCDGNYDSVVYDVIAPGSVCCDANYDYPVFCACPGYYFVCTSCTTRLSSSAGNVAFAVGLKERR